MKNCNYIFNDKSYNDYESLLKALTEGDLEGNLSLLFSLDLTKQSNLVDKLESINKKDYKLKKTQDSILDNDTDISVNKGFSTQTFIDSAYFTINGESPMFRQNNDEYIKTMVERKVKSGEVSEEDAELEFKKIVENWKRIGSDASDLHRIVVSSTDRDDDRHFSGSSINTSYSGIFDQLGPLVRQIEKNIWQKNKNSTLIRNLNLEAQLRGLPDTITGHIDYLFVKDNGDIEIFNIAASIENEQEWDAVKVEKIRYKLALIKRILEYNGISSKNVRLNIIPVKMKYDEQFENILEVSAEDAKSYDFKGSQYIFQKYDNIAAQFIDSNVSLEEINDDTISNSNKYLNRLFQGRDVDIRIEGIKQSAKGWVKHNWRQIATQSLEGKGWDIKLPNEKNIIHVEDTRVGENNEEVVNLVFDRSEELFRNTAREKATYRVVSDIQSSYRHGLEFFSSSVQGNAGNLLSRQLSKYFEINSRDPETGTPDYKWELIENNALTNANIVLFRHKVTNQLDVVNITPFDVSIKSSARGRDNILGWYLMDQNDGGFIMESNYGNIEIIKSLILLNEILPKFDFEPKLGTLKILGLSQYNKRGGKEVEISQVLPNFDTIVQVLNRNNSGLNMPNNFKSQNVKGIDWSQQLIQTWREAIESVQNININDLKGLDSIISQTVKSDGTVIEGLETISFVEGKIEKITMLIDRLEEMAFENGIPTHRNGYEELLRITRDSNKKRAAIAQVYCAALKALSMYYGDYSLENEEFSQFVEYFTRPQSMPNSSVRTVAYMFQKSINTIADQMLQRYSPIRSIVDKYYKEKNYSPLKNSTIGNQAAQFSNLYEIDPITGEKTMRFKNPYSNPNDTEYLKQFERDFLKDILWELNKIRFEMKGMKWDFTGKEDPKLIEAINNRTINYLNVPLERASTATRRENIGKEIVDMGKRWGKRMFKPKEAFKEFSEDLMNEDEQQTRDRDIENLQAYNPFANQESSNVRENLIREKGLDYFETNVEKLFIDYLEKHLQQVEYNKLLTRTKAILLDLRLKGEAGDNLKNVNHTVKTIEDFLDVSVFNRSIMEETSQKIEAVLSPLRRAVSMCYIAANPEAMVRDTLGGILENMVKSLTKFQTEIDIKDIGWAYKELILEGPGNPMRITKYDQLNVKYRLSNLDVSRISEGLKTGKGGLANFENWAYSTLRAPDYLNRMVLFAAQMKHDGCEEAYFIKEGKLVYDWRKDKRFSAYASNDMSNKDLYNKQRSLYLSLLRQFNQEKGTKLVEGDNLPDAYTLKQIDSFKTFSDNIYGSYNESMKWKLENTAIGVNFTVFSTWLNAIVDVYGKKPQLSNNELQHVQERNDNGQLLYFDKYTNAVTLEEGGDINCPVMTDVPKIVQGCFYTLRQFFREFYYTDGTLKEKWDQANSIFINDINRRNRRRMFTDMLIWLLLGTIFKTVITPAYKEHKKTGDGNNIVANALLELTYNGGSSCYDSFSGPFAVLDYFGNSTNPATYKLQGKMANNLGQFLFGEKTLQELVINSQALPRSFQDTYYMWARDNQA